MDEFKNYKKWDLEHILPASKHDKDLMEKTHFLKIGFYDDVVKKTIKKGMDSGVVLPQNEIDFSKSKNTLIFTFRIIDEKHLFENEIEHKLIFQQQSDERDMMLLENCLNGLFKEKTIDKMDYYENGLTVFEDHLMVLFNEIKKILED